MLKSTLPRLRCPSCAGPLEIVGTPKLFQDVEIRSGSLKCRKCKAQYLILAGVALLVEDTENYLLSHVKGLSKWVKDTEIPAKFLDGYREAKAEISTEHIEEDLEAERVNALYLINHYLTSGTENSCENPWWKPAAGEFSPLIDSLIRQYWDQGPFTKIRSWVEECSKTRSFHQVLELGCGVGGLWRLLKSHCDFYLGADSSFASIALARHLNLGAPSAGNLRIPEDLLQGKERSREIKITIPNEIHNDVDFVVMDFQSPALALDWDLVLCLNMIDMLDQPQELPRLQYDLLKKGGRVIHSCPYVWHEGVARNLRKMLPSDLRHDSARAVEWLYQKSGFTIEKQEAHLPWLFYKHFRQLEIYSAHLFSAQK